MISPASADCGVELSDIINPPVKNAFCFHSKHHQFFNQFQEYFSAISFVSLWLASVLLLSQTKRKWRTIRFWLLVTIPLAYYFGAFQIILSLIINQYDILNQIQTYTFDLINSILTRPLGGVLFGIAFWTLARNIGNENIRNYMRLSAFGIMLLSISNVDTGIFMLPYPPFGLVTLSFLGISSYLLLVGIYNSAISVSLDHKIRSSIQNSVEHELRFVSKIGVAQMERDIQQRVKYLTRKVAEKMETESGVTVPMEEEEVDRYIKLVIEEKERLSRKKNRPSDNEKPSS